MYLQTHTRTRTHTHTRHMHRHSYMHCNSHGAKEEEKCGANCLKTEISLEISVVYCSYFY